MTTLHARAYDRQVKWWVLLSFSCTCVCVATSLQVPMDLELQVTHRCWKPNSGPLDEQHVLLATEPCF